VSSENPRFVQDPKIGIQINAGLDRYAYGVQVGYSTQVYNSVNVNEHTLADDSEQFLADNEISIDVFLNGGHQIDSETTVEDFTFAPSSGSQPPGVYGLLFVEGRPLPAAIEPPELGVAAAHPAEPPADESALHRFTGLGLIGKAAEMTPEQLDILVSSLSIEPEVARNAKSLFCPVTYQLMVRPVILSDGQSYEKTAIQQWFSANTHFPWQGGGNAVRSPMTNKHVKKLFEFDAAGASDADLERIVGNDVPKRFEVDATGHIREIEGVFLSPAEVREMLAEIPPEPRPQGPSDAGGNHAWKTWHVQHQLNRREVVKRSGAFEKMLPNVA
jgi:hypothetical protein